MLPETHFSRVPREQLPPHMRKAWDDALELHGDTTFTEVFGNAPAIYDWYLDDFYKKVFYSGRLDLRLVELVRLRLANVHGCAHCNRGDRRAALQAGIPLDVLDSMDHYETGPFTEAEKAALALADEMALTNARGSVTRALYARVKAHFTDGELIELGVIMAVLCGMAKFIFTYDLVEKEDYCPFVPLAAE
jgi:AhpD family alkylhydroperoxidase